MLRFPEITYLISKQFQTIMCLMLMLQTMPTIATALNVNNAVTIAGDNNFLIKNSPNTSIFDIDVANNTTVIAGDTTNNDPTIKNVVGNTTLFDIDVTANTFEVDLDLTVNNATTIKNDLTIKNTLIQTYSTLMYQTQVLILI